MDISKINSSQSQNQNYKKQNINFTGSVMPERLACAIKEAGVKMSSYRGMDTWITEREFRNLNLPEGGSIADALTGKIHEITEEIIERIAKPYHEAMPKKKFLFFFPIKSPKPTLEGNIQVIPLKKLEELIENGPPEIIDGIIIVPRKLARNLQKKTGQIYTQVALDAPKGTNIDSKYTNLWLSEKGFDEINNRLRNDNIKQFKSYSEFLEFSYDHAAWIDKKNLKNFVA